MNEVANANAEELRETMGPLEDIGGLGPNSGNVLTRCNHQETLGNTAVTYLCILTSARCIFPIDEST